jgi:hypothetical protein
VAETAPETEPRAEVETAPAPAVVVEPPGDDRTEERFLSPMRGFGRFEMLPDGDSPFLEPAPQPTVSDLSPPPESLWDLAAQAALDRFRWDFDPDEAFDSGRVSVGQFFDAFP